MVEEVAKRPRSRNPNRGASKELRAYKANVHHGFRVDENGVLHTISGPLGSTITEKPPAWTIATAEETTTGTVIEEIGGPYIFTSTEVYVLAFGLCMVNRLNDEEDLRAVSLQLTQMSLKICMS